jgi:hypothetical protein
MTKASRFRRRAVQKNAEQIPPYKHTIPAGFGPVKGKFRGLQKPIHTSFPAGRKGTFSNRLSSQVISGMLQTP